MEAQRKRMMIIGKPPCLLIAPPAVELVPTDGKAVTDDPYGRPPFGSALSAILQEAEFDRKVARLREEMAGELLERVLR